MVFPPFQRVLGSYRKIKSLSYAALAQLAEALVLGTSQ